MSIYNYSGVNELVISINLGKTVVDYTSIKLQYNREGRFSPTGASEVDDNAIYADITDGQESTKDTIAKITISAKLKFTNSPEFLICSFALPPNKFTSEPEVFKEYSFILFLKSDVKDGPVTFRDVYPLGDTPPPTPTDMVKKYWKPLGISFIVVSGVLIVAFVIYIILSLTVFSPTCPKGPTMPMMGPPPMMPLVPRQVTSGRLVPARRM